MGITRVVVFALLLTAGLYDLFIVSFYGVDASISQFITDTAGNNPFLLVISALLIDHFFGFTMQRKNVKCPKCKTEFRI